MDGSRKITVKISRAAARYVQQSTPREEKLQAARGEVNLSPAEVPLVLFYLARDPDPAVKSAAVSGLQNLSGQLLFDICSDPAIHPRVLQLLARLHGANPVVAEKIAGNPAADDKTIRSLGEKAGRAAAGSSTEGNDQDERQEQPGDEGAADQGSGEDLDESGDGREEAEEEEEAKSTYQLAMEMGVSEKIKMALTGDKEWRMLLVKDKNKLVSGSVIKNPRITENEILTITKCQLNNDDILRDICINKEWIKNYQIRKSLVENSKTPIHFTLRFLTGLTEKDLTLIARSKNISSVIATQARRMLMNKEKDK